MGGNTGGKLERGEPNNPTDPQELLLEKVCDFIWQAGQEEASLVGAWRDCGENLVGISVWENEKKGPLLEFKYPGSEELILDAEEFVERASDIYIDDDGNKDGLYEAYQRVVERVRG